MDTYLASYKGMWESLASMIASVASRPNGDIGGQGGQRGTKSSNSGVRSGIGVASGVPLHRQRHLLRPPVVPADKAAKPGRAAPTLWLYW